MRRIKSFGVFQTSATVAAFWAAFGLLEGLLLMPMWLFLVKSGAQTGSSSVHPRELTWQLWLAMSVLIPLLFSVSNFVTTAFFCWFYNFAAKHLGGITIELSEEELVHRT